MEGSQFYTELKDKIFERDGGKSIYCGMPAQEVDHVIPCADGGNGISSNGVCACRSCNGKKAHHLEDFLPRAIFWLMEKGEDTRWMDKHYEQVDDRNQRK